MPSPLFRNFNNRKDQARQDALDLAKEAAKSGVKRSNLSGWLKNKIAAKVMKSLGPAAHLVEALLRPFGKSLTTDIKIEIEAAHDVIEHLNRSQTERVTEPVEPPGPRRMLVDTREEPEDQNHPPLIEGPIEVSSSNVHSIGYEHRLNGLGNGDLLVRFLGSAGNPWYKGKMRVGEGALYRYKDVPYRLFESFKIAASKGKWVWDELRIRGTVSGHVYDYELAGLGEYQRTVPRQAGMMRGQSGEFYIPRTFQGQRSNLPLRQVRGARSNLPGWDRRNNLQLRAGSR